MTPDDVEALLWLAEAHRGRDFAISRPPKSLYHLLVRNPPWANDVFRATFKLPYVRCLAVSRCGQVIAAGTKAGHVHIVHWQKEEKTWKKSTYEGPVDPQADSRQEGHPHEAIRAIGIADSKAVIAGTGAGTFLVFDSISDLKPEPIADPNAKAKHGREPGWVRRFTRMIPVSAPGQTIQDGPLMVGLTQGPNVHLLTRTDQGYRAYTGDLKDFLPAWPRRGLRLVDGAWDEDRLWLLGADGYIYRFRWAHTSNHSPTKHRLGSLIPDKNPSHEWNYLVSYPFSTFELRRVSACSEGLALLVSNHVTFLPFHESGSLRHIEPEKARWVLIDQIADIAVWAPFSYLDLGAMEWKGVLAGWKPRVEPVWIVAGSPQSGLHWTRWPGRPESLESRRDVDRGSESMPYTAPPLQTEAGRVAMAAFGCFANGASYLVTASRNHRLHVTSILHKSQTLHVLDQLMPKLLAGHGNDRDAARSSWSRLPEELRTPGVALWVLRARLYCDFRAHSEAKRSLLPAAFRQTDLRPLMEMLTVQDLRPLVHILLGIRTNSGDVEAQLRVFRRWVLEILRRAFQLSPEEPQRLAKQFFDGLAKGIRPRTVRKTSQRPVKHEIWRVEGPFAGFLRKWIINGNTYAIKETELRPRVLWNDACGYHLDAMVYLAKLTRRRFDSSWQARGATSGLPIWDLVAQRTGQFCIQSYTDGSLTAISRRGDTIRWSLHQSIARSLDHKKLKLSNSGQNLNHRLASEFWNKYHHGPYVRRLTLHEASRDPDHPLYLLLGCFRGWRAEDYLREPPEMRSSKRPLLFALLLRPEIDQDVAQDVGKLEIVALETRDVSDELYEIRRLEPTTTGAASAFRFLAGTRGMWQAVATPFVEIKVSIDGETIAIDGPRPVAVNVEPNTDRLKTERRDGTLSETAHNPCWCLTTLTINEDRWLWAGFADGHLRCYKRRGAKGGEYWIEGGGYGRGQDLKRERLRPQARSIPCAAAVWQVSYIEELNFLAYGTADGVVGLVSMAGLNQQEHRPWVHILHSREMAPISSLIVLQDDGEPRLVSVSQDGYATIYHLKAPSAEQVGRFAFPGYWRDRFPFRHSVQAAVEVHEPEPCHGQKLGGDVPTLLVGSGDGGIYKHKLLMPRGSQRRRRAAIWFTELMKSEREVTRPAGRTNTTPTLAYCVGEDQHECYAWLRVLDTGGLEMMRLSFWLQLHEAGKRLIKKPSDTMALEVYLELLDELTHEAYSRRPFGKDPSKILWEEASKVANRIATLAIREKHTEVARQMLEVYNRINVAVDDLCNRWIGTEQAIEASVLIHSFNVFLNWTDIVLIAWLNPPSSALDSQQFSLSNAIHRRLGYGNYMVRLETLRVINRAICWAIVNIRNQRLDEAYGVRIGLLPRGRKSNQDQNRPVGFYELLVRVGHLAESHHDSLSPADPLTSEIIRFFALSILLVPDCTLIVGHTMSECRLLDRGPELSSAIAQQAYDTVHHLKLNEDANLKDALNWLGAYCSPRLDLRSAEQTDPTWWRLMTGGAREKRRAPNNQEEITNADMLYEQRRALFAARALVSLERQVDEGLDKDESEGMHWLDDEKAEDQDYFYHSHSYLRHLKDVRGKIRDTLAQDLGASLQSGGGDPAGRRASEYCENALLGLEETEIFEPQRSHYREIILAWRDHIERRGTRAVAVLEAIDKFNRHIYRTSADNFMSNALEVALQVSPLAFDTTGPGPLSQRIGQALEDGHPLLREIFRNGTDLVEQTHLSGTLLALARYMLQKPRSTEDFPFETLHEVRMSEIRTEIENAAQRHRMRVVFLGDYFLDQEEAVGTRAIWRTIITEWVNNVDRHGRSGEPPQLRIRLGSQRRCEPRRRVLLLSGTKPFDQCLTQELADELDSVRGSEGNDAASDWLRSLAKEVRQPRSSQKISPTSVSGMGVFLICTICELVQLQADTGLYDLDIDLEDQDLGHVSKYPLCLEISWISPDGERGRE